MWIFNPFTSRLEQTAVGITSVNGITGALTLVAGSNITLTPLGNTITISSLSGVLLQNGSIPLTGNWNVGAFNITAFKFITSGGTSSQFVKGDGSLDGSTYLTANQSITLSGDVTGTGATAITTTLATVNSNVGSFGSSTAIPSFTVNGKGLITAASTNAVIAPAGTLTGTTLNSTVVTSSLTTVGTIGTGVWQGTVISPFYGGTGIANNSASTITISGNFATTLTVTNTTGLTLPTTGTLATLAGAETFTNHTLIDSTNVTEQITTIASSATPTPTGGSLRNFFTVTALAAGATFAVPSGSPVADNKLTIRIKDNGTAQSLAFNAIYNAGTIALPTTTIINKTMYLGFIYDDVNSKWDFVAYLDNLT